VALRNVSQAAPLSVAMLHSFRLVLVALVATLLVPPLASAGEVAPPGFGLPIIVHRATSGFAGSPALAVGPTGRLVTAWMQQLGRRSIGVVVRRGTPQGRFGRAQVLAEAGAFPAVAAASDGGVGAAVVWDVLARSRSAIVAAVTPGAGRFGRPQTIAQLRGATPFVKLLASGGRYVALWQQTLAGHRAVRYAIAGANGRFGAPRTLVSAIGPGGGVDANVAPDGTVVATFATPLDVHAGRNQQLAVALLPPGSSRFGLTQTIAAAAADQGAEIDGTHVAAGPGGVALGWTEQAHLPELLRVAPIASNSVGQPQTVLAVDSNDLGKRYGETPQLALPGGGLAPVAAWAVVDAIPGESESITGGRIFAAQQQPDGTYAAAQQLSATGTIAMNAAAAATASQAVITWTTGQFPRYRIAFAVRAGAGRFTVGQLPATAHAERPPVLASSSAGAALAWTTHTGTSPNPEAGKHGIALAILRNPGT
jgi:hypothetical protein